MNKIVEEKIDELQNTIRRVETTNDDVELVLSLMPNAYIWVDHEVNVNWPVKSMKEVKQILRKFAKKKAMLDHFIESPSQPIWYLKGINVLIRLVPTWSIDAEGATCRLVKVGENTYTNPIYKLVCDDEKEKIV